ncbi:MAG: hypothetical protein BVN34_05890 [Proteobacteria bacterium ST_bin12]|nr:MAG: hypothetical protein BVN34_05890 [Proteobacteria bacterium ST_bin12]
MKKLALAVALMGFMGSASAAGLSIVSSQAVSFSNYDGQPLTYTGARSSGFTGAISASSAGILEVVYLGQESANANLFRFSVFDQLTEANNPGDSVFKTVNSAGLIHFKFIDTTDGETYTNGFTRNFAILNGALPGSVTGANNYGPFDYILGFNDNKKSGDKDFDDYVVGLRFTPSPVPVPAALPLMATALGLFGFGASRRRV